MLKAFGGGYYKGGFEPKMTKREAALILGVRYVNTDSVIPVLIVHSSVPVWNIKAEPEFHQVLARTKNCACNSF